MGNLIVWAGAGVFADYSTADRDQHSRTMVSPRLLEDNFYRVRTARKEGFKFGMVIRLKPYKPYIINVKNWLHQEHDKAGAFNYKAFIESSISSGMERKLLPKVDFQVEVNQFHNSITLTVSPNFLYKLLKFK